MKNLISIRGAKALTKIEQKLVIGGGGGPVGDFEDCHENDPGIGDLCSNNGGCAQNQVCNFEGNCACGGSPEGPTWPNIFPSPIW